MDYNQLYNNILRKGSFLCTGLDSDPALFPAFIRERELPIFEFNRAIIDATIEYSVAYKPNLAFYEAEGAIGWEQLKMTVEYIRKKDSSVFIIADAKRGDIGNTAKKYASAFFDKLDFDAVTLAPYMGRDSIDPFLKQRGKWAIVLALTSNPSADDFETLNVGETPLYRRVIESVMDWGSQDNTMFVVGATRPEKLAQIREFCPNHFLLVPGVGTQGGTVAEVAKYGMNSSCGLLVNVSRAISFAWMDDKTGIYSGGVNFDKAAGEAAALIVKEMRCFLAR
ncbi:MAG: orotidine 5'-phosphate decarboxylase [Bacteroidetes bacterium GWF2_41_61]|nr:MAG: orotidine 5'-phosphate decarboxylase [Bacteroidetes bacterium GWF2_41_61]OFY90788.1 MAG: orotidine 5'-phosphate decarboxylase [Bacteroidetes bacterium RIFOXYA12_FULL_40_10]HBG24211.1 orotidine-5'-phosphate decarboxylase [Rikenellaceae bacterium]